MSTQREGKHEEKNDVLIFLDEDVESFFPFYPWLQPNWTSGSLPDTYEIYQYRYKIKQKLERVLNRVFKKTIFFIKETPNLY